MPLNKETKPVDFTVSKDRYLDLARELKETVEHEGDGETNHIQNSRTNPEEP